MTQASTVPDAAADGLTFVLVRHAPWCPGAIGSICICNPTTSRVSEAEWLAAVRQTRNRAQRRAAARQARKAPRREAGHG